MKILWLYCNICIYFEAKCLFFSIIFKKWGFCLPLIIIPPKYKKLSKTTSQFNHNIKNRNPTKFEHYMTKISFFSIKIVIYPVLLEIWAKYPHFSGGMNKKCGHISVSVNVNYIKLYIIGKKRKRGIEKF